MATHKFGEWEYTDEELDHMHEEAVKRGEERLRTGPLAEAAHYDAATGRVVVELIDGCTFAFPVRLAQDLADAAREDLQEINILGPGTTLDWPRLDVQFSISGLMEGRFGNAKWMERLANQRMAQAKAAKPKPKTRQPKQHLRTA